MSAVRPEPLRRIDMRNEFDCGVACVAMLTGLAPDEIEERIGYKPEDTVIPHLPFGLSPDEVVFLLHQEGLRTLSLRTRADMEEELHRYRPDSPYRHTLATMRYRRLIPDHDGVLAQVQGRVAMLTVRHRTMPYGHFVVWDHGQIIDPHHERRVEREGFEEWEIRGAIIVLS